MNKERKKSKYLGWLFAMPLALAALIHGSIHTMYVSGLVAEDGALLGFDGHSWLLGDGAQGLVTALVAVVILGNALAALGLARIPVLRDKVRSLLVIGNAASLVLFAVMVGGLSPDPVAHVFGPITSLALLLGALFAPSLTRFRMSAPNAVARFC